MDSSKGFSLNKILVIMLLLISSVFAEVINKYPSQKLIDSKITIIDIRTKPEWKETGLLSGAIPITFFDEKGKYDIPLFMQKLQRHVKPNETFAIICHTGSRTAILADFLAKYYHMKVINLRGGMHYAQQIHLKSVPYMSK